MLSVPWELVGGEVVLAGPVGCPPDDPEDDDPGPEDPDPESPRQARR
jgi:hypothetical protein